MKKKISEKQEKRELVFVENKIISEKLSGEVTLNEVKFPKQLGEEHPFDFKFCEGIYKKFGYATSAVDKHIDFIAGTDFQVKSDNEKAEKIINMWIEDSSFKIILRDWLREALVKGNGFMEIDNNTNEIRLLNANTIYIERNKKGEILGYNQVIGDLKTNFNLNKTINFNTSQIIHLPINKIGDCPYGHGIIYPALKIVDYILQNEKDMHTLISRKANSPYHVKVGTPEEPAQAGDLGAFGAKLEYLNNMHEWVTDHRIDIKTIDFGNLGEKFASILDHDMEMLIYTFQVPEVLMGKGNIAEGLANVQLDAFSRRIKSIQALLERIIEDKIFKIVLLNNGLQAKVEFEWNMPSDDDINDRIDRIQRLLMNPTISPELQALLEIELAKLLDLDDNELKTPEELRAEKDMFNQVNIPVKTPAEKERKDEEKKPMPPIPGTPTGEHICSELCEHIEDKDYELEEWINFNYKSYLRDILKAVDSDQFENLVAKTTEDIDMGLLTENDINKLKVILKNGFKKGSSIRKISNEIKDNIDIKDRYILNEAGEKVLKLGAQDRPIAISRTETLRLANIGTIDNYRKNDIERVSWLATVSPRTCQICLGLNGQVMTLNEFLDKRETIHPYCRCSSIPITE